MFDQSSNSGIATPLCLRLSILILALVGIASCNPGQSATNNNAVATSSPAAAASEANVKSKPPCLNLNSATTEELIRLPGVGEIMAKKIIDYRERHGRIRRAEEIIILDGFSERKYRAIEGMICVE